MVGSLVHRRADKQARMLRELGNDVLLGGVAVFVNEKSAEFESGGFQHILDTLEEQSPQHVSACCVLYDDG